MPEGLNSAAVHIGGAAIAAAIGKISLHSADPSTNGANISSAGKVTPSSIADVGGVITVGSTDFTGGAASGAVVAVGYWDSAGTTWYGYNNIEAGSDTSFNAAGEYTLTSAVITGSAS